MSQECERVHIQKCLNSKILNNEYSQISGFTVSYFYLGYFLLLYDQSLYNLIWLVYCLSDRRGGSVCAGLRSLLECLTLLGVMALPGEETLVAVSYYIIGNKVPSLPLRRCSVNT